MGARTRELSRQLHGDPSASHHRSELGADADRIRGHHLGAGHLTVVLRLVSFVSDEVEDLFDRFRDHNVAFYPHHADLSVFVDPTGGVAATGWRVVRLSNGRPRCSSLHAISISNAIIGSSET